MVMNLLTSPSPPPPPTKVERDFELAAAFGAKKKK